jgi:hypothetical protein
MRLGARSIAFSVSATKPSRSLRKRSIMAEPSIAGADVRIPKVDALRLRRHAADCCARCSGEAIVDEERVSASLPSGSFRGQTRCTGPGYFARNFGHGAPSREKSKAEGSHLRSTGGCWHKVRISFAGCRGSSRNFSELASVVASRPEPALHEGHLPYGDVHRAQSPHGDLAYPRCWQS